MLKKRVAVLVSGGGTNLQALIDAEKAGRIPSGHIVLVVSNRADAYALTRAESAGIRAEAIPMKNADERANFEAKLQALLTECGAEVIVLAGFLSILSKEFVGRWSERILNVHPSLIPAFCGYGFYGLRVHRAVLEAGVAETGATVHMVNEVPDAGRILLQKKVCVLPGDTPESLQQRVMKEAEHVLLPQAVEQVCHDLICGGREMEKRTIDMLLWDNPYPGRGVALGCTKSGRAVAAYFIMGRSANSRNRIFEKQGNELGIRIWDKDKLSDPSLILYAPLRLWKNTLIVTNGDQTDTVLSGLERGESFEAALQTRSFEPDAPNFTPRISGLLHLSGKGGYCLSILKAQDGAGNACTRQFFHYELRPGCGHLIHTYQGDGSPLPSFSGEPREFAVTEDIGQFSEMLWSSLNRENRVALYVRFTEPGSGAYEDRLYNSIETGESK